MKELCRAAKQHRQGAPNKNTPTEFYLRRISQTKRLKDEIRNGTYKPRPTRTVIVTRPKRRIASAPWTRDCVWQRSMCNNGVYRDLTKSSIYDNMACQKGKGTDLAIRRVIGMLQRLHRENPGAEIYGKHLDIKQYFPSTPQKHIHQLDEDKIADKRFIPYLSKIVDGGHDRRPQEEIERDPYGRRGTDLGSPINQLHQISLMDKLDHELKSFCKYYIRYNDDFLILDHDRAVVGRAEDTVQKHLAKMGLQMTNKSGLIHARRGFYFLRKRFLMKESGKIIIRLHRKALSEERQTLKSLLKYRKNGLRTMDDIRRHYQCWVSNAEYAGDGPIREMDKYYTRLFREKPVYKRKRRYLYGKRNCGNKRGEAQKS
ncbi:MAG: hypothetical protein E7238_00155 [Sarcina sp.]|nr:hypothetical protein [Sarcina sp.]